jgi:hypothetical protein
VRLQDKLLALHGKTTHAGLRRYLVREMERVVPALDSSRVIDAVSAAARSADAGEAFQARRTMWRFQPRHVEARFGPGERLRSVVTGSKEAEAAQAPFGEVPLRVISLVARPALERVLARLPQMSAPLAARAAASIGRLVDASVEPALEALLPHAVAGPVAALALARRLAARDPGRALALFAPHAEANPELVVALAELDHPDGAAQLIDRAYATPAGAVPAAIALEGLPLATRRGLVERMLGTPRGWALVHALASLARGASADEVPLVAGVLRRFEQPLVRVESARCLGRIAHPAAREACRALIAAKPDAPETTAALDGLLRQAIPDAERLPLFEPALASRDPEALAFACLGLAGVDPDRAASGVRELLTGTPEARVHGAHLLAYLPGAPTIRLLSKLVTRDPEAAVRRQAAVSLTYQPASPVLAGALMTLIGQVEPALQPTLAPALAHARETADPAVLELLAITQKACPPGARKHIESELTGRPDPDILFGALGACGTSALHWPQNPARAWLNHREPAVAARACIAMLQDDPKASIETLVRLIDGDDAALAQGLDALATMVHVAETCLAHPRYRELVKFVEATAKSNDYSQWVSTELALPKVLAPAPRDATLVPEAGDLGAAIEEEMETTAIGTARAFLAAVVDSAGVDELEEKSSPAGEFFWGSMAAATVLLMLRWVWTLVRG